MSVRDENMMARAMRHQKAGEVAQAETICRQVIRADPQNDAAWNLLGILAFQKGKHAETLTCFGRARAAAPTVAVYCLNHGALLQGLGRHHEAEAAFRDAIRLAPTESDTHYNLGNTLRSLHRFDEAEAAFREAFRLKPDHFDALLNLAVTYQDLGRLQDALDCYRQLLAARPNLPAAHNNLGNILQEAKRYEEAEVCYRKALTMQPNFPEAHNNLGNTLRKLRRYEEAEACFRQALQLRPNFPEALNHLGVLLTRSGKTEEAEQCLRRSLALNPMDIGFHNNLAVAVGDLGRLDEMEQCFRRSLELHPNSPGAGFSMSLLWLLRGEYEKAWPAFELRHHVPDQTFQPVGGPRWDGSRLGGRTLFVQHENGLGDSIQMARFARMAKERGGKVLFQCPHHLLGTLRSCAGIDEVIPYGTIPPYDVHIPLMSLPAVFGTTVATIPAPVPYLTADAALVERWRQRLKSIGGFRVGIVWQGNPDYGRDRLRSVPLAQFEPLACVPTVELIGLQVGFGAEQKTDRFRVTALGREMDADSLSDAAAILMNLDLLISVDTALVHLAGALGVRVWTALPLTPDWRWLLNRDDTPWYPTMRLFRQTRPRDWDGVFTRIAETLAKEMSSR